MAEMTEGELVWRLSKTEDAVKAHGDSLATQGTSLTRFEEKFKVYDDKMEEMIGAQRSINNWLRGIFGSVFVALVLLIFELISHARATAGGH